MPIITKYICDQCEVEVKAEEVTKIMRAYNDVSVFLQTPLNPQMQQKKTMQMITEEKILCKKCNDVIWAQLK